MSVLVHDYQHQAWVKAESTYGTALAFAATDAVDFQELKIHGMQEYSELRSHLGTASLQDEVAERHVGTWEMSVYCAPQAAGTAPDYGEILKHAYGVETVSGGTSVTYAFSDAVSTLFGLQLTRYTSDNMLVQASGAWVEQVQIAIKSGEPTLYTFSGGFASLGMCLEGGTVGGTEATGQTVIGVTAGDAVLYRPGVFVKFTGDDNSGAGYRITAVDYVNDEITITPGIAGAGLSSGNEILPNIPSQTLGGTVYGGINCGLTIGGTSMDMIEATTTIDTGIRAINDEATQEGPSRLSRGRRKVSSEITIYYDATSSLKQGSAWNSAKANCILRSGPNTAAKRCTQNFPNARLGHITDDYDFPEESAARFTLPIKAHQNSTGADEHTLVYD